MLSGKADRVDGAGDGGGDGWRGMSGEGSAG